jgi:hypothetical protein
MYTHGDAVGGNASTLGTLGFATSPSFSSVNDLSTIPLTGTNGAIPAYTLASGAASGNQFGTGYTNNTISGSAISYSGTPSSMTYDDPYLGSRAPQYINWTFGIQRQISNTFAVAATYVGSEGHFVQTDSLTGRGLYSNQLDPKYFVQLGSALADTGTGKTAHTVTQDCATYGLTCAGLSQLVTSQPLSTLLKPYPFQTVADSFGYIGNTNYHGLQFTANMRSNHGLTFNANYTWSRTIDDGGTFRSGYDLPVGTVANHLGTAYKADSIERTVSTSNQPQHLVVTAVWDWQLGKTILASNSAERAVLGGFKFSGIFQAYSGSPLAITATSCQTNPSTPMSSTSCAPTLNPNFIGSARIAGKWGKGATTANYNTNSYIVPSVGGAVSAITDSTGKVTNKAQTVETGPFVAPVANIPGVTSGTLAGQQTSLLNTAAAPAYTFGDSPRTAPYGLTGPGNYQLDLALVRTFPLHITEATKLNFRAEWYNVTNHTQFAVASTVLGSGSFGQVTSSPIANRKIAQFSARIEF